MTRLCALTIYFTMTALLMVREPVRAGGTCDSDTGVLTAITNRAAAHDRYAASPSVDSAQSLAAADYQRIDGVCEMLNSLDWEKRSK